MDGLSNDTSLFDEYIDRPKLTEQETHLSKEFLSHKWRWNEKVARYKIYWNLEFSIEKFWKVAYDMGINLQVLYNSWIRLAVLKDF